FRYVYPGPFAMKRGTLDSPTFAYETWGTLNSARDNAVLVFTGLSPSAHAASSADDPSTGWWEDMIGPDKPIDTTRFFVICVNSLGSCFGSTGPASINPATGEPYRLSFPILHLEDIARGGAAVLDHLGIEAVHTALGSSMGGMTVLAFAMLFPERARGLVSISAAARSQPFAIAIRSLQRELIRSDPDWERGHYPLDKGPLKGMRLARKLGMISYRSADEWAERFGRERANVPQSEPGAFGLEFEVESYLEAHAMRFAGRFDPNCYLYLSRAMDLFDAADHGGTLRDAFARVRLDRAMVIGVETDFLFPVEQQEELAVELARQVPDVRFHRLASLQGHDAFLVDMDRFRPLIAQFFD
ncbi:MAG: homoserine O-acetyltransferase MetX, partial [Pseudomonadales bacterium]